MIGACPSERAAPAQPVIADVPGARSRSQRVHARVVERADARWAPDRAQRGLGGRA